MGLGELRKTLKSPLSAVGAIASACLAASACTSDVELKPAVATAPSAPALSQSVGFNLRPLAQTPEREVEPYRQGHVARFNVGPASADLFRRLIPAMFVKAIEVDRRPPLSGDATALSAVIEPKLESFHFYSLRIGEWRFWADVTYRFNLYSPDGTLAASWTTRGEGEAVGMTHGEAGTWGKAVERAIEEAGRRFATSFVAIPEAKRWLLGRSQQGAAARADLQRTLPIENGEMRGAEGSYDGVVRIRMELDPSSFRTLVKTVPGGTPPRVLAVKLTAENLSRRPLAIRTSRIHLVTSDKKMVDLLPVTAAAALLSRQAGRVGPVAPGVGVAALPALFAAFANLAASESERGDYQHYMAALQGRKLVDAQVPPGGMAEGLVFFPAPGSRAKLRGVDIVVPVIDAEPAMRYAVRLPVGERPPSFKPYIVKPAEK